MKKLRLLICLLLLSISLVGCGGKEEEDNYTTVGDRTFYIISSENWFDNPWDIYVDVETKVQYLYFRGDQSNCAVMEILVDADGKPILYEGSFE